MTDKGTKDKVKGEVKETAGDLTNNTQTKAEGVLDKAIGKAKEIVSDTKDKASGVVDDVKKKVEDKS